VAVGGVPLALAGAAPRPVPEAEAARYEAVLRDHDEQAQARADELEAHTRIEAGDAEIAYELATANEVKALWQAHALDEPVYRRAEWTVEKARRSQDVWRARAAIAVASQTISALRAQIDAGQTVADTAIESAYRALWQAKLAKAQADRAEAEVEVTLARSLYQTLQGLYDSSADSKQAMEEAARKLGAATAKLKYAIVKADEWARTPPLKASLGR
jgi:predicted DNA-binding protein (UPF0278 family)